VGFKPGKIKDSPAVDRNDVDSIRGKAMAVEDTRVLGGPDQEFRRSPLPQATEA
jgi:hypothetical protein